MEDLTIISADSHMVEPPKLWVERLDKKYRDRAPHTVSGYAGNEGEWYVVGSEAYARLHHVWDRNRGRGHA